MYGVLNKIKAIMWFLIQDHNLAERGQCVKDNTYYLSKQLFLLLLKQNIVVLKFVSYLKQKIISSLLNHRCLIPD